MIRARIFLVACCAAAGAFPVSAAQAGGRPDYDNRSWFGHLDLGLVDPQSHTADVLDDDWTLSGGAMFWPSEWPIGLNFDFGYTNFDLTDAAIQGLNDAASQDPNTTGGIDDGEVRSLQLTVNAVWGPGESSQGVYFTGGVGYYQLQSEISEVGLVYYPPVCDPWFWWCYPGGVASANIIRGEDTESEFGYNVGVGYSFDVGVNQMFIEISYHEIPTDSTEVNYMPITFGWRW